MELSISIIGSKGRMGQKIAELAPEFGISVAATSDVGDDIGAAIKAADVVIDFSFHGATEQVLRLAVEQGKALVVGTTGHSAEEKARLLKLAADTPCVWTGNYSVGVNLLYALTEQAAQALPTDYNAEVVETHHRHKKDAPSGTATDLLNIILQARGLGQDALRHGRKGVPGERGRDEVGIHSLRGGDIVGEHTALFIGEGERIELTHRATDRAIFARGALRAASWIITQKPGVYSMREVLGLKNT